MLKMYYRCILLTLFFHVVIIIMCYISLTTKINNNKISGIYRTCVKGQGLESWIEAAFLTEDPCTNVGIDSRKYGRSKFYSLLLLYTLVPYNIFHI